MNINFKQAQFELFPGSPGSSTDSGKPRYLFANLTLSLENVVVLGILSLMIMLFAFSLGVEKGKSNNRFKSSMISSETTLKPKPQVLPKTVKTIVPQTTSNQGTQLVNAELPVVVNRVIESKPNLPIANAAAASINKERLKNQPVVKENLPVDPLASAGVFTIQIASYKAEEYAQREMDALKKRGIEGFALQKGDYFILCVGKFQKKNEADKALGRLKKQYNDSLVRRL